MPETTLDAFFEHNLWANLTLLETFRAATEEQLAHFAPGTYGPVAATLLHMLSGEQSYVWRLNGEERPDRLQTEHAWPGIDALLDHARWSGDRLRALAASASPTDTVLVHDDEQGYHINAGIVLVQAINHATEHRAHVCAALTSQGLALREIDGWNWAEATPRS